MKGILLVKVFLLMQVVLFSQQSATVKEYKKTFKTYPFSDPDPVPQVGRVYPYFRFDGYTNQPINKEWNVVELENDYIKVMILPEIGGKIWAAIEKSTGKSFIYYNHVVKFRDVAMRGPWTSGGIEANYGIVGHTPNCATPVDYTTIAKPDGSVSCVIGVLDLLTRTTWRIDINLPRDKAYFTTTNTWYNASAFEQPYYTWMNTGLKSKGNLQFIYPGTKYLGHAGEYSEWPIDKKGRDLSFYENNNFGEYKSYHVFGKYTNFFGAYYHDEDFGMARYSTHDDKPGKKIWIWGLSQQGMIWEKLLSDDDGQYVEVQSGRLFNQPAENSSFTPFKNRGFVPNTTDTWQEYWFPVMGTKGFVVANNYGSLNIKKTDKRLVIYFSPVQAVSDSIKIIAKGTVIYAKHLQLKTLQPFRDSIAFDGDVAQVKVVLGDNKLVYEAAPDAGNLSRPVQTPTAFNWNSVQGLYLQGKELIRQRMYTPAEEKLRAALQADPFYLPALADLSMLLYRQMKYTEALEAAKKALSIDTYAPAANYYYGLVNEQLGHLTDAKDGFDIAAQSAEFRSAANVRLANIYFRENDLSQATHYTRRSIAANEGAIEAYQLLAVIYRKLGRNAEAKKVLDSITAIDALNHFANFERYLLDSSNKNRVIFFGMIKNEMPEQTLLELAAWYHKTGLNDEALRALRLGKPEAEIIYWRAYLSHEKIDPASLHPGLIFPFRNETADILEQLIPGNDHWLLKYHLALIRWNSNNMAEAKKLFDACAEVPNDAAFYAARAKLFADDSAKSLSSLLKAESLDKNQWRYGRALIDYYLLHNEPAKALSIASSETKKFPGNYIIGMLYAKVLIANNNYELADKVLEKLNVLPNEGATGGRQLYRETKLMLALKNMDGGNYKKSLQYISAAKIWPDRLGSGKPYQEDIDERPEDWLAYQCYLKLKDELLAKKMLNQIVSYSAAIPPGNSPSVNHLISAWAMEAAGKKEDGQQFLQQILTKHPADAIAQWMLAIFDGRDIETPQAVLTNENYKYIRKYLR